MTRRFFPCVLQLMLFFYCLGMFSSAAADLTLFSASAPTNPLNNANDFARSAAMGSAFAGVADDASALFTNPAGLGFLNRGQLFLNSDLWLVGTFQETALVGLPSSNIGGFGFAAQYLDYGSFEGRDEAGSLAPSYGGNRWGLEAGWGYPFSRELALGVGLSVVQTTLAGTGSTHLASSLGALWKPQGGFGLGASYVNAGWVSPGGPSEDAVNLGASYETALDSSSRFLASAGGSLEPGAASYLQAGVEYSINRQLFLRAGYQQPLSDNALGGFSNLTAGVGLQLSSLSLDYAYLPYGDLGSAHRISVGYFFGPEKSRISASTKGKSAQGGELPALPAGPHPNSGKNSPWLGSSNMGPKDSSVASLPPLPVSAGLPGGPGKASSVQPAKGTASGSSQNPAETGQNPKPAPPSGDKDSLVVQFDMPDDASATDTAVAASTTSGADLEKQGKYREAAQAYLAAVQQNPQDVSSWWALGNLYRRFNQKEPAVKCFEKVLELKPGSKELADWLEQYKASQPKGNEQ